MEVFWWCLIIGLPAVVVARGVYQAWEIVSGRWHDYDYSRLTIFGGIVLLMLVAANGLLGSRK